MTLPAQRHRVTVDAARWEVDVVSSGPTDAPVAVLVHGIGMSHRYFERLQHALSGDTRVHAVDLPGFGATPRPSRPLAVEDQARILAAVLDSLGVASATLVGHSMGTQFVVELARQRPDLAARIVLIGPVVDDRRRTVARQALSLALDTLREPPSANRIVFTDYLRCGTRWYLQTLPAMMDYPTEQRIRDLGCPVLVLRGQRDPIATVDYSRRLAAAAPEGRMLQLPGHAHVVQHSAPVSVSGAIRRFMRGEHPAATPRQGRPTASPFTRARWWMLDYLSAGWWQVRSLASRASDESFRVGTGRPVVVVPGVFETWRFMEPLIRQLHGAGHPVHVVRALRHNVETIPLSADRVAAHILEHDLSDVVIVGHSKGGLIGKLAMLNPEVAERITAMVTVATPFGGSRYARVMLSRPLREFSPHGQVTRRLSGERGVNARIRSVFGVFDPHIPEGTWLADADNVRVDAAGHFRILSHPCTVAAVLDAAAHGVGPTRAARSS